MSMNGFISRPPRTSRKKGEKCMEEKIQQEEIMDELNEDEKRKIIEEYDSESRFREFNIAWMARLVTIIAVGLALFHLITSFTGPLVTLKHRALHTGVILTLVFLLYPARRKAPQKRASVIDFIMGVLSILTIGYIFVDYTGIVSRSGLPNDSDVLFSFLIVLLVLEGGRRVVGNGLTILCSLFLLYAYFGPFLPNVIAHRGYSINDIAT